MTILLLSGGLDSVTILYCLEKTKGAEKIHCVLVDYKSKHNQHELSCARLHCRKLGVNYSTLTLPPMGGLSEENWQVPNRNMVLLAHATSKAIELGAKSVFIGCNADDASYFPDCRPEFISAMNAANLADGNHVVIEAPLIHKTKKEIAATARLLGINKHEIWTCYQPTESGPCQQCPACMKLKQATE